MKASAVAAAALVAVALGVGKGAAAGQDSAAAGLTMQPGQWEMAVQMTSFEIPGASPETLAEIRGQVGQTQTNRECITPERARNPLAEMQQTMAQGRAGNCQFTDQVFGGGVIRIGATCAGSGTEGSAQVSMEGSFTATTMQMTLTVSAQGANPAAPQATGMRMTANLSGRYVGECPARPAPPAAGEPAPVPEPPPTPRP